MTASCGIEVGRVIDYKPLIEGAIELADHKPQHVDHQAALAEAVGAEARRRRRLGRGDGEGGAGRVRAGRGDRSALHPLHVGHHRPAEGRRPRQRRASRGAQLDDEEHLRRRPGEVWWAASDVGWVVGHSYIVYAPLIHGATTIVYEGKPVGTPDAGAFWRVISQHKVVALFTAPTAFRAIKRDDPNAEMMGKYDLSHFRILFLAGERTDPDTLHWAENARRAAGDRPLVADRNRLGDRRQLHGPGAAAGEAGLADPAGAGLERAGARRDLSRKCRAGQSGSICVKLPLPPGALPTLWNNDERFVKSYLTEFPGYYMTADAGFMDEDGYVYIMARTDDVINVAGHRLSTGAMEEVLSQASGRRRMCRRRRLQLVQGPAAGRLRRAQAGRHQAARADRQGTGEDGPRPDRPGCRLQDRDRRRSAAEDPLGQDPARHHAEDRRQPALEDAGDHRRSGDPRRDQGRAGRHRLRQRPQGSRDYQR